MGNENYFLELSKIDFMGKTKAKNGLTYLSWAYAWQALKSKDPNANSKVYETPTGCIYWTDGKTCWVKVSVTTNNVEHIEYLPIMNNRNQAILASDVTTIEVNKAIQRALTKAIARHGVGLYIYAGEDLPTELEPPFDISLAQAAATSVNWPSSDTRGINLLQESISKRILKLQDTTANEVMFNVATSILNGIRVSQTTEKDKESLLRLEAFLSNLGEQLKVKFDE